MYWFFKVLAMVVGRLSPRTIHHVARCLAFLVFSVFRIRRKVVLKNLEIVFGGQKTGQEQLEIGFASVYHLMLTSLEFLRSEYVDIAGDITLEGAEHIRKALSEGRGCYILCCHLGNWEAFAGAVTRLVAPAHVAVKKVGSDSADRYVCELREINGLYVIPRKKKGDAIRAIKSILTRNEVIGFVLDQTRPGEPRVPFFGKPAKTNTGLASMWRRYRAPIVPGFIRRIGVGQHVISFFPQLNPKETSEMKQDVLDNTHYFNEMLENMILRCPEQYLWVHNRWK